MDMNWSKLAERRMLAALAAGELSHLPGEGQPLKAPPPVAFIDPAEAVGLRLMAEAGYLPDEIRLRKLIEKTRAAWHDAASAGERKRLMARLAELTMKEAIARETRLGLFSHH